jgi:hypothetical protein
VAQIPSSAFSVVRPVRPRRRALASAGSSNPFHCEDTLLRDSCRGITDGVLDPNGSPPQVRMRVGTAIRVELSPINPTPSETSCVCNPGGAIAFTSNNPVVARIEKTIINTTVTIRAESRGDADIVADAVSTPTGLAPGAAGILRGQPAGCFMCPLRHCSCESFRRRIVPASGRCGSGSLHRNRSGGSPDRRRHPAAALMIGGRDAEASIPSRP